MTDIVFLRISDWIINFWTDFFLLGILLTFYMVVISKKNFLYGTCWFYRVYLLILCESSSCQATYVYILSGCRYAHILARCNFGTKGERRKSKTHRRINIIGIVRWVSGMQNLFFWENSGMQNLSICRCCQVCSSHGHVHWHLIGQANGVVHGRVVGSWFYVFGFLTLWHLLATT